MHPEIPLHAQSILDKLADVRRAYVSRSVEELIAIRDDANVVRKSHAMFTIRTSAEICYCAASLVLEERATTSSSTAPTSVTPGL